MEPKFDKINNPLEMNPKFETVYQGKMFEVVTWEGKPGVKFEAAIRAPGVRLIIETEKDGTKALVMTKEIRREAGGNDFRLPGGKVFDSLDEFNKHRKSGADILPLAQIAAEKEGKEEAGVDGGQFTPLGISKAGASVEWDLHYFLVSGSKIGEQHLEESEQGDIETIILSAEEVFEKLKNREIKEGRSADMLWVWLSNNGFIKFEDKK
jgi:8-oxo-dGTP pyrophosphatase MutT (NUDIX family)